MAKGECNDIYSIQNGTMERRPLFSSFLLSGHWQLKHTHTHNRLCMEVQKFLSVSTAIQKERQCGSIGGLASSTVFKFDCFKKANIKLQYLFDYVFSVEVLVSVELLLSDGWQNGLHRSLSDLR